MWKLIIPQREDAADESDDDNQVDMAKLRHQATINKHSKKKARELKTAAASVKKRERKKNAPPVLNFSKSSNVRTACET
jgi:protein SDA1